MKIENLKKAVEIQKALSILNEKIDLIKSTRSEFDRVVYLKNCVNIVNFELSLNTKKLISKIILIELKNEQKLWLQMYNDLDKE